MIIHDSRNINYRNPFGAVTPDTRVSLSFSITDRILPDKCFCRLWNGNTEKILPMLPDDKGIYSCSFNVEDTPVPLWYYFIIDYPEKTFFYGNNKESLGGVGSIYDSQPPSYQITVYDKNFKTPEWFRKGSVYHIFVDRFSRSVEYTHSAEYRRYHDDWYETPFHTPADGDSEYFPDDFFGGNLRGIIDRLPYLKDLGIATIYLSPVFEARSNHKYDTGDYTQIDRSFGTGEIFSDLCEKARTLGIRIILDGVFSHTGDDSIYFNKYSNYDSIGAYNSTESEYYSWYMFEEYPDKYKCWWDVVSMPTINKDNPAFTDFICAADGIASTWIKAGASGWRLDVADELPMEFLRRLRKTLKSQDKDSLIMGEVWEDASNKVSYGKLRNYCRGDSLDSVMNYPAREAILGFLTGELDSVSAVSILESQLENYPREFLFECMNLLGSHDRVRLRTFLSGAADPDDMTREEQSSYNPPEAERKLSKRRIRCAASFLFVMPGVPHIFYGDEAGLEGMADPFNRKAYPWNREDKELLELYTSLSNFRMNNNVLINGSVEYLRSGNIIGCRRVFEEDEVIVVLNRASETHAEMSVDASAGRKFTELLSDKHIQSGDSGNLDIVLSPLESMVLFTNSRRTPK